MPAPQALTQACQSPVVLPQGRDLTQLEVERNWTEDRVRLVDCGKRHEGAVRYYTERDRALTDGR